MSERAIPSRARRLALIALVSVAAVSGCAAQTTTAPTAGTRPSPTPASSATPSPREDVPSALVDRVNPTFPAPLIDPKSIVSGGPPPDGIPPIDHPTFLRAADVDFVGDNEAVIAVEVNGESRAYPVQILIWHELVNDTVAGIPVTVSYCPLCNSAVAFDRRAGARVLDFGTSGSLYQSALVMYDRQTESLWTHFDGRAVVGALTGTKLTFIPVETVGWKDWRDAHPGGRVLSRHTGFARHYGTNPYVGYDDPAGAPIDGFFEGSPDGRLPAKERVVGIRRGSVSVAVPLSRLARDKVLTVDVDGQHAVVFWKAGTASALDTDNVGTGRDVGSTAVFSTRVDGRDLTFAATPDGFEDTNTHTQWDLFGMGVAGSLQGRQLEAVEHVDTFGSHGRPTSPAPPFSPNSAGYLPVRSAAR